MDSTSVIYGLTKDVINLTFSLIFTIESKYDVLVKKISDFNFPKMFETLKALKRLETISSFLIDIEEVLDDITELSDEFYILCELTSDILADVTEAPASPEKVIILFNETIRTLSKVKDLSPCKTSAEFLHIYGNVIDMLLNKKTVSEDFKRYEVKELLPVIDAISETEPEHKELKSKILKQYTCLAGKFEDFDNLDEIGSRKREAMNNISQILKYLHATQKS